MQKYITCFSMGIQKAVEYRFDFLLGYISAVFPIIIQVSMWTAIYQSAKTGTLYGYSYTQMILYTFFVGVIGKFLSTGFEYEMNDDIKNGGLNKYIVKPVNYYFYRSSCFLGERFSVSIVFFLIIIGLFIIFYVMGYFQVDLFKMAVFFIAMFFALMLNFSFFFCIGISGLWVSEISRVFPAVGIIVNVISGGVFPLDILGEGFNEVLFFLPFQYMLQFPVDVITGKDFNYPVVLPLFVQFCWVIIFWLFAQSLWKKGLRKYIAIGG